MSESAKASFLQFILYSLIPFGQLFFRIFKADGSLDKMWLMFIPFFFMFPFQMIPMAFFLFGWVKKGQGGKPYDIFMLIPLFGHIFVNMMMDRFEILSSWFIRIPIFLLGIIIPFILRERRNCKDKNSLTSKPVMMQIFKNAMSTMATAEALPAVISILGWVPIIGLAFSLIGLLENIPLIGPTLFWGVGYFLGYIFTNMINGRNIVEYCKGVETAWAFRASIITTAITIVLANLVKSIL